MKRQVIVAAAIAAMLLVPVVSAFEMADAPVTAMSALGIGDTTTESSFLGFLHSQVSAGASGDVAFELEASGLRVERDRSNMTLDTGVDYPHEPYSSSQEYGPAHVVSGAIRGGALFMVFPTRASEATLVGGDCARLDASASEQVVRRPIVYGGRPANTIDAAHAATWDACGAATLRITGDFLVRLWEWDATLTTDTGPEELHSGRDPIVQGLANAYEAQELYLFASNASLNITVDGAAFDAYIQDATTTGAAGLRFTAGEVNLPAAVLEGQDVTLHGSLAMTMARGESGLTGTVSGHVTEASVDGAPWAPQAIVATPIAAAPVVPLVIGAAVLLVLLAAWLVPWVAYWRLLSDRCVDISIWPGGWREKRGAGYWYMAAGAGERVHPRLGRWLAHRSERLFPGSPDAIMAVADADLQLERFHDSVARFAAAYAASPTGKARAVAACGAARVAAAMRDAESVQEWLQTARGDDEVVARDVSRHAEFQAFKEQAWMQALCSGPNESKRPRDVAFA